MDQMGDRRTVVLLMIAAIAGISALGMTAAFIPGIEISRFSELEGHIGETIRLYGTVVGSGDGYVHLWLPDGMPVIVKTDASIRVNEMAVFEGTLKWDHGYILEDARCIEIRGRYIPGDVAIDDLVHTKNGSYIRIYGEFHSLIFDRNWEPEGLRVVSISGNVRAILHFPWNLNISNGDILGICGVWTGKGLHVYSPEAIDVVEHNRSLENPPLSGLLENPWRWLHRGLWLNLTVAMAPHNGRVMFDDGHGTRIRGRYITCEFGSLAMGDVVYLQFWVLEYDPSMGTFYLQETSASTYVLLERHGIWDITLSELLERPFIYSGTMVRVHGIYQDGYLINGTYGIEVHGTPVNNGAMCCIVGMPQYDEHRGCYYIDYGDSIWTL